MVIGSFNGDIIADSEKSKSSSSSSDDTTDVSEDEDEDDAEPLQTSEKTNASQHFSQTSNESSVIESFLPHTRCSQQSNPNALAHQVSILLRLVLFYQLTCCDLCSFLLIQPLATT
jgi:hypothetical protein